MTPTDIKTSPKVTVIKTDSYWQRDEHKDVCHRIKSPK